MLGMGALLEPVPTGAIPGFTPDWLIRKSLWGVGEVKGLLWWWLGPVR